MCVPTEDNLPIGKRVEGGGNNGLFSNSLTLSEIAGGFSGSVSFFEDDTNVPCNLLSSPPYYQIYYVRGKVKHTDH
jgi:hypothetical protein